MPTYASRYPDMCPASSNRKYGHTNLGSVAREQIRAINLERTNLVLYKFGAEESFAKKSWCRQEKNNE
jgi:hypothetical protein